MSYSTNFSFIGNPITNYSIANISSKPSEIDSIPEEILAQIACYLDLQDVAHFGRVNHHLSRLFSYEPLWKRFLEKDFPDAYVKFKLGLEKSSTLYKQIVNTVHNMQTGKCRSLAIEGHQKPITCIFPYEDKLISGSWDETIKIWNLKTGQKLTTLNGHNGAITYLITYEDKLISSSNDNTIKTWNLKTGEEHLTLKCYLDTVSQIVVDDGMIIASSWDRIKVWDLETGEEIQTFDGDNGMRGLLVCAGTLIAISHDDGIKTWDFATEKKMQMSEGAQNSKNCIIYDGKLIFALNEKIVVWDIDTGQELKTLYGHEGVVSCVLAFDNKLVSSSWDKTIKIWDIDTGQELKTLYGHEGGIHCILTFCGKLISGSRDDKTIKIWDLKTGQIVQTYHQCQDGNMTLYDNKLISYSANTINILDFNI